MSVWQNLPLGDVLTFQRGFDITKEQQRHGPYPVISSSGPKSFHSEYKLQGPGVIIGRKGSLGTVYYSEGKYWPHDTTLWIKNFHGNYPRFVYYFLQTMGFERLDAGASNPTLNRNHIHTIPVMWPSLLVQQRIAGILTAYDELIENSQRRIKILEAMARGLYRKALAAGTQSELSRPVVDSPFWRFISENISNYVGSKCYLATADIDGLAVTGPGIEYRFSEKPSRAQKQPIPNSVWFARMKETYKIAWYGPLNDEHVSGLILSSGFAGFEARETEFWPLLFLTISSKEFHVQKDLFCTGATQMSLTNEGLSRIILPLPDEQSARNLGRICGPMLNAIAGLQGRNEKLRRTRDLLLSRLLSDQIDVSNMESSQ